VIRREAGLLPQLIRGAAGDRARAKRVGAHVSEVLYFLHTHHSGEDELLWPVLRPKVALEQGLIDRMEAQHEQVAAAITGIEAELPGWQATADPETGERLAAAAEAMNDVLADHLAEEEERILPLVGQFFTQPEWDALGEHGFASVPPRRRLVVLASILEEASPAERERFMEKVPAVARLAFRLFGRRQYNKATAAVRAGVRG
jgi:hypothetical protein